MSRSCEKCNADMPSDVPRKRVAGLFVCGSCTSGIEKVSHDMSSRDPLVVMHCCFCGSGQVVGRNDGSVECGFCQSVFTARIEPFYSGWPQTVNGIPQNIPLHPNELGDNAGGFEENMNNTQPDRNDFGAGLGDEEDTEELDDEDEDFDFQRNSSLSTAFGGSVDEDAYIKHLAIRLAGEQDRDRVIDRVRML